MAGMIVANPKRKPKQRRSRDASGQLTKKPARRSAGKRRNPVAVAGYRRRSGGGVGGIVPMLGSAAMGAGGGLLIDLAMKPLPLSMKTGPMKHLTAGGMSIGLALLGSKFPAARQLAHGALTVAIYNAAREQLATPLGLSEISEADMAAIAGMGASPEYTAVGMVEPQYALSDASGMSNYDETIGAYDETLTY